MTRIFLLVSGLSLLLAAFAQAAYSLEELVSIKGIQENEVSGTGLVYGLAGTGDKKNPNKEKMIEGVLRVSGIETTGRQFDSKNTALVQVTGRLPAFAGKGQALQLQVSTIGDAKSLKNGILHFTMLGYPMEPDNKKTILATAEGPLEFPPNFPETTGLVRGIVQTEVPVTFVREGVIQLMLKKPDFTDAARIARQVNQYFMRNVKKDIAVAVSAGQVNVDLPDMYRTDPVTFISEMEKIPVLLRDVSAKVRINSKTGMVTFNERVELSPAAISYKDLTVVVNAPNGEPGIKGKPGIDSKRVILLEPDPEKPSLQGLVDALNAVRVMPEELVEIVKELHKIGAIQAELIIE